MHRSVTTASYTVTLAEELYDSVEFQPCGEYEVAWVDGVLAPPPAHAAGAHPPALREFTEALCARVCVCVHSLDTHTPTPTPPHTHTLAFL